jgi:CRISPR-associated protein Csd2
MEVIKLYWWQHNNKIGQYSAAKVHDSLKISLKENVMIPTSVDDYNIVLEDLPDLKPEIIEGI